jgi:hypothetical protein
MKSKVEVKSLLQSPEDIYSSIQPTNMYKKKLTKVIRKPAHLVVNPPILDNIMGLGASRSNRLPTIDTSNLNGKRKQGIFQLDDTDYNNQDPFRHIIRKSYRTTERRSPPR